MCRLGPALDVEDRREGYRRTILLVSFLVCLALHASTGARLCFASSRFAEALAESSRAEAAGQTVGAMTGAINGTVTDSTGAVLPLVTIVISSAALMGTRTTVTNAEGLYRFPALAPGEYALMFTLDGFKAVRREGIHVGLGFTATVNVNLQIATLQENVIVERNSPVHRQTVDSDRRHLRCPSARRPARAREACGPFRPRRRPCMSRASISVPAPQGSEALSARTERLVSIGRWSRASA